MALYALGDLHLSFQADKSMEAFGDLWHHYVQKIDKYCGRLTADDTLVLTGDHSWGKNLAQCATDLKFIESFPGRKILLRGNHDMFWDAKKTQQLNDLFKDRLYFLQNNFFSYGPYALVGTKGYCYEGLDTFEHFEKIRDREVQRLQVSFDAAVAAGYDRFIMFLHYPPTSIGEFSSPFTEMAESYGVEHVVYSHCHGRERFGDSYIGEVNGIEYHLVSGDYLGFKPERILK